MTRTVHCVKLGREAEGLDRPPYPGELGQRIFENVSKEAWKQWLAHQTMLINEYRLVPFEPKARNPEADIEAVPAPLLTIQDVVAGYGQRQADGLPLVRAVQNVSLKVEKGRNLGIIGESGCGKSTLARTIAGILPAAFGKIVFDGKELGHSAREQGGRRLIERTERDRRQQIVVLQLAEQPAERRIVLLLFGADGGHDEE